MSVAEFSIYLNDAPADEQQIALFSEIKVDQAIGMVTEAELQIDIGLDATGVWSNMQDDELQAFERIRVEVKVRDGEFTPLIDGPVVAQRFNLSASPNNSRMTLVVHDDSVLMNMDESVESFEETAPDQIAQQLFQQFGITAQTDSVSVPSGGLPRFLVKRGTAMQFLRQLARRHGMFVYVEAGDAAGVSNGYFKKPQLESGNYPELLLIGAERNINQFSANFDALKPVTARVDNVDINNQQAVSSEADSSQNNVLGDEAVHEVVTPGSVLLARSRESEVDLEAAALAAVDHSSWAYSASAEVRADNYPAVLKPYKVISVAGAGGYLSGDWLISRVTHSLDAGSYKQALNLRRNARSSGAAAGGGLLAGIF